MLAIKNHLTAVEAAEYCRLTVRSLERYRAAGNGPKFIRFSSHKVLYDLRDLDAWMTSHKFSSTKEAAKPRRRRRLRSEGGGGGQ